MKRALKTQNLLAQYTDSPLLLLLEKMAYVIRDGLGPSFRLRLRCSQWITWIGFNRIDS